MRLGSWVAKWRRELKVAPRTRNGKKKLTRRRGRSYDAPADFRVQAPMTDPGQQDDATAPSKTDEQLLLAYIEGDTDAFTELLRRYRRELFSFLFRFTGNAALAEDVFQETFLQLHLSVSGFDMSRRLKPWLFTIAANKARDALRSRSRRPAASLDATISSDGSQATSFVDLMPSNIPSPMQSLQNQETADAVQSIVAQMPEGLRSVLVLSYFHDFHYKQIAEILNVPLGTVKSRLHVAVKEFARRWKSAFGTPQDE